MIQYAIRWSLNGEDHLVEATSEDNAKELQEAYAVYQPSIVTRTVSDWEEVA